MKRKRKIFPLLLFTMLILGAAGGAAFANGGGIAPEAPTYEDLSNGDSNHTAIDVTIKCVEDHTACYSTEYKLFENTSSKVGYSLGEVQWDVETERWYCDVTIIPDDYITSYSKSSRAKYTAHELTENEEKTKVIRFWYMEEYAAKGTNPWRTEDGYSGTGGNPPQRKVTFEVIHTVIPRTITCKLDNVTSDTINLSADVSQKAGDNEVVYYAMSTTPDADPSTLSFIPFSEFTAEWDGILPNTTYYFWAKVNQSNSTGLVEAISEPIAVTTLCSHTDDASILTHHGRVEADCTTTGSVEYWSCEVCGKNFADAEGNTEMDAVDIVIPSAGHKLTHHGRVEASCTTAGSTEYWSCEVCGKNFADAEGSAEMDAADMVIPAMGHDFGEWETAAAPSCTGQGSEQRTCSRCEYKEYRDMDPVGHDWEDDFTVDQEPACTQDGSKSIHCSRCDATKDSTVIPATGHSYTAYVTETAATCTEKGTEKAVCDNGCGETDVRELPALGHEWSDPEWKWAEDYSSAVISFTCKRDEAHVENVEAKISKNTTAATCTEAGSMKYSASASFEGKVYTDEKTEIIAAVGHRFKWVIDKEATATEKGSKHEECEVCGNKKDAVEIPATGTVTTNSNGNNSATGTVSNTSSSSGSPKTGDDSYMILWIVSMGMALIVLAGTVIYRRRVR